MSDIDSHLPELVATGGPNVARSSDLPASSLPWMVTELEACFVVIDSSDRRLRLFISRRSRTAVKS